MPLGQDYYLLINNVPHGPYTTEQMQDWIKSQSSQADLNSVSFAIAGSSTWEPISLFSADLNYSNSPASDYKESMQMTRNKKVKYKNAVVLLSFLIGFIFIYFAIFKQGIFWHDSRKATESLEDNRIKIKGIYLGMSIEDACGTLQKKFNEIPELSSIKLKTLNTETVGWEKLPMGWDRSSPVQFLAIDTGPFTSWVIASGEGKVFNIRFNFPLVEALYSSRGMENIDFIRTFMNVNGIPEMEKEMVRKSMEYKYLSPRGEHVTIIDISNSSYHGCTILLDQQRSTHERIGDFK